MEPVGELYEDDPDVVVERQKNSLEVLRLHALLLEHFGTLSVIVVKDRFDFGKPVHQGGDFLSEEVPDILHRIVGVFNYVVEKGGAYGLAAEPDVGYDNLCNLEGMEYIRLSRASANVFMGFVCKNEGLLDKHQLLSCPAPAG